MFNRQTSPAFLASLAATILVAGCGTPQNLVQPTKSSTAVNQPAKESSPDLVAQSTAKASNKTAKGRSVQAAVYTGPYPIFIVP